MQEVGQNVKAIILVTVNRLEDVGVVNHLGQSAIEETLNVSEGRKK